MDEDDGRGPEDVVEVPLDAEDDTPPLDDPAVEELVVPELPPEVLLDVEPPSPVQPASATAPHSTPMERTRT